MKLIETCLPVEALARAAAKASDIRQLAYYLYTHCEKHGDAANARAYNALITNRSEIMALMGEMGGAGGKLEQSEWTM